MAEIIKFPGGKIERPGMQRRKAEAGDKTEGMKGANQTESPIGNDYLKALTEVTEGASRTAAKFGFTVKDVLTDALVIHVEQSIIARYNK